MFNRSRRGIVAAMAIGITLGDPAGIGPEVVAAAIAAAPPSLRETLRVFGDPACLARGAAAMGVTVDVPCEGAPCAAVPGQPDAASGAAQVAWLEAAIAAARAGEVDGLVTAPISKTWAQRAGLAFPGHTELLAARFGVDEVAMTFVGPRLTVALATVHIPLATVAGALTSARIVAVGRLLAAALIDELGVTAPVRLGVVGLNPHAGEQGLLGDDEARVIAPAIATLAAALGPAVQVTGPMVPDAAFRDAVDGRYHGLVAMYHDQALIPVKLVDFEHAVNVTLGLPVIRTSVDHGTALDLAGAGDIDAGSLEAAVALAIEMASGTKRA